MRGTSVRNGASASDCAMHCPGNGRTRRDVACCRRCFVIIMFTHRFDICPTGLNKRRFGGCASFSSACDFWQIQRPCCYPSGTNSAAGLPTGTCCQRNGDVGGCAWCTLFLARDHLADSKRLLGAQRLSDHTLIVRRGRSVAILTCRRGPEAQEVPVLCPGQHVVSGWRFQVR